MSSVKKSSLNSLAATFCTAVSPNISVLPSAVARAFAVLIIVSKVITTYFSFVVSSFLASPSLSRRYVWRWQA
nr:MAG TPA: hypothetical protein [Caudoviricetes sp.]